MAMLLWCTNMHYTFLTHATLSPVFAFASLAMSSLPFPTNANAVSGVPLLNLGRATISQESNTSMLRSECTKERIKKLFNKVELSVSSYDTAWVAMVPKPDSPTDTPCFPGCVNWLLNNQLPDGSWGLHVAHHLHHRQLTKDSLSSTLASLLALKRWGVGEPQITNGLQFIESKFSSVNDGKQHSPIGFDIIFPGLIQQAQDMGLNLPLEPTDIDAMLQTRDSELARGLRSHSEGGIAYLAYVSEGLGKLQDWPAILRKYKRRNGSLFNSPSTTAAALTLHPFGNARCLDYLLLVHKHHMEAVPAVYPLHVYARLSMVDTLVRLGIEQHFEGEIRSVLDETYRCWIEGEEEIFMDTSTCAMAFRMLREHRYEVSSDPLAQFAEEKGFFNNTMEGYLEDKHAIVELYKASQMIIHPDESHLKQLNSWTSHSLKHKSPTSVFTRADKYFFHLMDDTLKFQYQANLQSLAVKTNIEHYNVEHTRVLKSSYRSPNISNEDFKELAVENFNFIQSVYRKEFEDSKRWFVEKRLDKLKLMWQKLDYCYFTAAATLTSPESSDARMSWAKTALLTALADHLFDSHGYEQDKINLVHMVDKWDVDVGAGYLSEPFEIFYSALHSTVCEIGDKARILQERDVTSHLIETWSSTLKAMLKEEEWKRRKSAPTLDEYMSNGYVSFAFQPTILSALYLLGPKLSEEVVQSPEFLLVDELMCTIGRLLNDVRGFRREAKEGKDNAVSLRVIHSSGAVTEEEAVKEIEDIIDKKSRELMRLVLQKRGSPVPKACKKLFWKASRVFHLVYMKEDGFHSLDLVKSVQEFIHEPIVLNSL